GTGDMARMSASKTRKGGLSVVYDMNRKMIGQGRKKKSGNVAFVQGDAETVSFHDETFDAVSIGFGIRNVTHMETVFREIYRVLKKGGTFCCLEFSKPVNPVFRSFYDFYSFTVMPFLGQCITGSRQAYTAFPESIRAFPLPGELAEILKQSGFRKVRVRRLTNGIAVLHTGKK
ncbi:MAG: ubiquinone/menaquinone biosynthesis methyltransferase, partial [Thermodesulfobacteriota bacterium]